LRPAIRSGIEFFDMQRSLLLLIILLVSATPSRAQTGGETSWVSADLGFRPVAITTNGSTFWACGSGESVASSSDGHNWQIRHRMTSGGSLLLGIAFSSDSFGYAFGTGGTLLTSEDGGTTWTSRKVSEENILLAALSDSTHGLLRTTSSLLYFAGGVDVKTVPIPASVPKDFQYTPSLAALSPDVMAAELSEGPYSEAGFVSTIDGGKSWTFYDPPSIGVASFLRVGDKYWAIGHEVVGKDKPGGGYGVPLVMSSTDARTWQHTAADIQACHWETCRVCKIAGCLASSSLIVAPYGLTSRFYDIPAGHLTAKWAAVSETICSVDGKIYCAPLGAPKDVLRAGEPQPKEQTIPPLGTRASSGTLRCISCSVDPILVDDKVEGRYPLHIAFVVRSDGTMESADVKDAPTDALRAKVQTQMMSWLFEPPTKDAKPINVSTGGTINITVVRSR